MLSQIVDKDDWSANAHLVTDTWTTCNLVGMDDLRYWLQFS